MVKSFSLMWSSHIVHYNSVVSHLDCHCHDRSVDRIASHRPRNIKHRSLSWTPTVSMRSRLYEHLCDTYVSISFFSVHVVEMFLSRSSGIASWGVHRRQLTTKFRTNEGQLPPEQEEEHRQAMAKRARWSILVGQEEMRRKTIPIFADANMSNVIRSTNEGVATVLVRQQTHRCRVTVDDR